MKEKLEEIMKDVRNEVKYDELRKAKSALVDHVLSTFALRNWTGEFLDLYLMLDEFKYIENLSVDYEYRRGKRYQVLNPIDVKGIVGDVLQELENKVREEHCETDAILICAFINEMTEYCYGTMFYEKYVKND